MSVYAFELSDVIYTYHVHVSKVHTIPSIVLIINNEKNV